MEVLLLPKSNDYDLRINWSWNIYIPLLYPRQLSVQFKKNFLAKTVKSQSGIEVRTYNTSLTYLTPSFSLRLGTNSVLVIQLSDSRKGSGRYAYCQLTGELGDYWRGSKGIRQSQSSISSDLPNGTTNDANHISNYLCKWIGEVLYSKMWMKPQQWIPKFTWLCLGWARGTHDPTHQMSNNNMPSLGCAPSFFLQALPNAFQSWLQWSDHGKRNFDKQWLSKPSFACYESKSTEECTKKELRINKKEANIVHFYYQLRQVYNQRRSLME